jgi:hypothetical protein
MLFDCALVLLQSVGTAVGCSVALGRWDACLAEAHRDDLVFFADAAGETAALALTLAHYAHVWSTVGLSATLVDVVLFLSARSGISRLARRVRATNARLRRRRRMARLLRAARPEEVGEGEDCAICRDELRAAEGNVRILPCGHVFHDACVRRWMQRRGNGDTETDGGTGETCPVCRRPVLEADGPRRPSRE